MFKSEAVVVGAGVIGLSIARALAGRGLEVLVLEAESRIGQGVSSRNSEVIHAGLYYPPGSLKARFCVEGRRSLYRYCSEHGVPHRRCGKLVVATTPDEDAAVQALYERAQANGVEDIALIGREHLKAIEPDARHSALVSGTTGIVDGHALMLAYQGDAEAAGAAVQLRAPFTEAHVSGASITLVTGGHEPAEIETGLLVNAAGLQAWDVSSRLRGLDPATIPPRHLTKGSYFSMSGRAPFSHLIYPVPMPGGLGIHLTFDLGGAVRFGPDAEWVDEIDYEVDPERGNAFYAAIRRYWPDLPNGALAPDYAGIRPRIAGPGEPAGDFIIQGPAITGHKGYVALYGIESPGLTASLAIGDYVANLVS
ncbi:FAD-dependent oxidoreductase [Methyloceanibacter superfactus]|uniref:FAD-dependent oxidoreductase n=1 Tax=Methyloceanibacter superfactus TaxID=1774969 RepID=A0A1E3VV69_9HYPH|nr:NAD(P)/FAD-dependent oxidoreductase [Methyloceanibacter superfactus]ODR97423.1 FAD-dependent oxidoreductase [Methyloceanibacter superfactus]